MSRWLPSVVGVALLAHAAGLAAERPVRVRLVGVTSESTAASQSVLITATEPASYTTLQPDPLTVLIMLRDVAAGDMSSRLRSAPDDPVKAVEVLETVDGDGNPVAQVRIGLREPTTYEVRSWRQTIQVRFARPVASTPTSASEVAAAAPPVDGRGRPATAILSVGVEVEPDAVSVTLHGNGALAHARIHEAEQLPPRLFIDFPDLAAEAAPLTPVEIDPVTQVRMAAHGPELTRVVFDLVRPTLYHIEHLGRNERILRVVFPRERAIDPVARIGGDPAPETATQPDALGAAPPATPTVAVEPVDGTALATVDGTTLAIGPQLTGPVAVGVDPSPLLDPDREIARLDGPVAFIVDTPLVMPAPIDEPPRVAPEIPRLDPTSAAADSATPALLPPESLDLPTRVDDTALSVTSPAVVAEVATSETEPRTTAVAAAVEPAVVEAPAAGVTPVASEPVGAPETSEVPIAASRQTEQVLAVPGSGRPTGAPAPGARMQLLGQAGATQQEFTGDPISMDFQGTDLRAVLRVFAEVSGLNLVIDPSVQGEVNVALTQVPWDQAFAIILRANDLAYEVDGTIVRIASVQKLSDEAGARRTLRDQEALAGELEIYTRTLSYARAEDLAPLITSTTLSERGEVFTDSRTNTLIIRDLADPLTMAGDLLDTLDRAEAQVEIEARIVQAGHDSARALGVQWGVTGRVARLCPEFRGKVLA